MKPVRIIVAAFALLAAACAPKPPLATAEAAAPAYEAALHALIECGLRQIVRLDDGRSDAATVARAAVSRCDREKVGFQEAALSRVDTPSAALAANRAIEDSTQSTFASLVLEVRAYRREHGARPRAPVPSARRPPAEVAL